MTAGISPARTTDGLVQLSSLLSPLLVAFTIECDNEAEHLLPHRTTENRENRVVPTAAASPWLVSLAMWLNCLRYIPREGLRTEDLLQQARISTVDLRVFVTHLRRWGYLQVGRLEGTANARAKPADLVLRLTSGGAAAEQVWRSVTSAIEDRWQQRFGREACEGLRAALKEIGDCLPSALPAALPILQYGWFSRVGDSPGPGGRVGLEPEGLLVEQLAKVLLGYALEVEDRLDVSLAIGANLLPELAEGAIAIGELPRRTGIAKESVAVATGFLVRHGYAIVGPVEKGRGKQIVLTSQGERACADVRRRMENVESRWRVSFGDAAVTTLRFAVTPWVHRDGSPTPALWSGLTAYPEGWRAQRARPERLPRYPVITHRGGYPDGS
jgi:hypothetical protein